MEKKIIAVACVLVILAVTLAACGSKYLVITDEHGYTHLAVTDAEGNTVLDENGDIQVYVTDENGEPVTLENGAYDVAAVTFPDAVADGDTLETPDYTLTMPDGWTANSNGRFTRDDNENVYLQITNFGELEDQTLDTYVASMQENINALLEQTQQEYPSASVEYSNHTLSQANRMDSRVVEFRVPDADGNMAYYAMNVYFVYQGELFKVDYICIGSYDESFDVLGALDYSLVMR